MVVLWSSTRFPLRPQDPAGRTDPRMSSKASAVRHLGAQRLGRFAIDDTFEFGRPGTPEPSGRSSLSARRQRFCCFRCLVTCRSGTASGKWTPRSKPELRQASTEFGFATIVDGTRLRPTSYVQRQWAPIGVPGLGNGEPIVPQRPRALARPRRRGAHPRGSNERSAVQKRDGSDCQ